MVLANTGVDSWDIAGIGLALVLAGVLIWTASKGIRFWRRNGEHR